MKLEKLGLEMELGECFGKVLMTYSDIKDNRYKDLTLFIHLIWICKLSISIFSFLISSDLGPNASPGCNCKILLPTFVKLLQLNHGNGVKYYGIVMEKF